MNGIGNKPNPGVYVNGHYVNPRYLLSATSENRLDPDFNSRTFDESCDTMEMADPE